MTDKLDEKVIKSIEEFSPEKLANVIYKVREECIKIKDIKSNKRKDLIILLGFLEKKEKEKNNDWLPAFFISDMEKAFNN